MRIESPFHAEIHQACGLLLSQQYNHSSNAHYNFANMAMEEEAVVSGGLESSSGIGRGVGTGSKRGSLLGI